MMATIRVGPMKLEFRRWSQRVVWLVAIWVVSVGVLSVLAWFLRVIMKSIGMSPP